MKTTKTNISDSISRIGHHSSISHLNRIGLISLFLIIVSAVPAWSQIQLTQYFQEHSYYNPATTGGQSAICASINARQQWIGLTDVNDNNISPTSLIANVQAPIFNIHSGVGLNIIYDNLSLESTKGVKFNYAYHMPFGDGGSTLSAGIGVSLLSREVRYDQFTLEQPGDPLLKIATPESGSLFDADLGLWYNNPRRLYAGVSVTSLMGATGEIGNTEYGLTRNINLTAGYYIKAIEKRWEKLYIIPSLLIKSNLKNMQIDFTARAEYNDLMGGLSYRHQDALAVIAGYNFSGLRLGLSYDLTTGPLSRPSSGSAEIFASWCLPVAPKVKLSNGFNTRYL